MAKTAAEIERNPHFHAWEYRGNAVQRALKIGPRVALYAPLIPERLVMKALEDNDDEAIGALSMAFAGGSSIYNGAGKTIKPTRWWLEFAEGKEQGYDALYKKSAWAYRCVEIRAQALAQIPWQVVKPNGDIVEAGPLYDLLNEINPESNWQTLIAATEADLSIYGYAAWKKVKEKNGSAPLFIQRLAPSALEIERDPMRGIGAFLYGPSKQRLQREEVVYFRRYNPTDEIAGLSPLEICRNSINIEALANEHMADFFENYAMPQYIFSAETNDQNELKRLATAWHKEYGTKGNRFKTAFVGGKSEPKEMGYAPDKLALTEVREEAHKSICSALGVPPVLVGAWEAANYATADEQRQGLYTETIIPEAEYLKGVINSELAPDLGEERFEWEYEALTALQEDEGNRANRLVAIVGAKIIKPEVAAEELGYDATDVPEPAPVPDVLKPFAGEDNKPKDEKPEEDVDPQEEALAKWRRKAIKRLKDGKSPAVEFESPAIPKHIIGAMLGALSACKTVEDVERVFGRRVRGEDTSKDRAMVEMARANAEMAKAKAAVQVPVTVNNQIPAQVPPVVNVPEQPAPVVNNTVNVAAAKAEPVIRVEPPVNNITVEAPPKLVGKTETQSVKRDAKGNIVTTESKAVYRHEGD
jgi:HK97 family phage portal protein